MSRPGRLRGQQLEGVVREDEQACGVGRPPRPCCGGQGVGDADRGAGEGEVLLGGQVFASSLTVSPDRERWVSGCLGWFWGLRAAKRRESRESRTLDMYVFCFSSTR